MKFEELSVEDCWNRFRVSQIPTDDVVGEFILGKLRTAFIAGAFTMLAIEERLRTEPQERSDTVLDRCRGECENSLYNSDGDKPS